MKKEEKERGCKQEEKGNEEKQNQSEQQQCRSNINTVLSVGS